MIAPHLSRLEGHLEQKRKYQASIDYLTQENDVARRDVIRGPTQDIFRRW